MRAARLLTLGLWLAWPRAARGQLDSAAQRFVALAESASRPMADLPTAIAAGYRAVGPEVPAMGQHWVNMALLLNNRLDPAHPEILEYATIDGRLRLVGVAYTVLLGPGDPLPNSPVPARWWHTHAGDVDEESLGDSHAGSGAADSDRVAVLHVWAPAANPAGVFAAENWTLPFLRAGLAPPASALDASARALALGSGALRYFLVQYRSHAGLDSAQAAPVTGRFAAVADSVMRWQQGLRRDATLTARDVRWLADQWQGLAALLSH